jgi:hypothetical protein
VDALCWPAAPCPQKELSLLLALLASMRRAGRLIGRFGTDWPERMPCNQLQQALQSMRVSTLSLRQQAYHALHDIVGGAYFSRRGRPGRNWATPAPSKSESLCRRHEQFARPDPRRPETWLESPWRRARRAARKLACDVAIIGSGAGAGITAELLTAPG